MLSVIVRLKGSYLAPDNTFDGLGLDGMWEEAGSETSLIEFNLILFMIPCQT